MSFGDIVVLIGAAGGTCPTLTFPLLADIGARVLARAERAMNANFAPTRRRAYIPKAPGKSYTGFINSEPNTNPPASNSRAT